MPNLNRNVTFDEDGEFACELVLQDTDLPVQIRATIHEGLGWLAIRHIQMGLVREKVAARHFSLLAELSPKTFDFAYKAGMFMLAPSVTNNKDALKYLQRAIANADPSKVSAADLHQLHHLHVKALRRAQRHEEAEEELYKLLERYPYDFETLSVLKYGSPNAADLHGEFQFLDTLHHDVQMHGESEYVGFRPPCSVDVSAAPWQPAVYSHVLSEADFAGHVERREPFIVRLGSAQGLSAALGWGTDAWRGDSGRSYLRKAVGEGELVLVESRAHHATETAGGESFGFGLNVHRKLLPFDQVLENDFTNEHRNESIYLNIQQPLTTGETHRTPLHLLKKDIPFPAMLNPVLSNITEVNLWMGVARDRDSQSKLHTDATDNLYVVLEGSKHFSVISPADALSVRTVSPTYVVSPDGLSFQFNVPKFREYALRKARGEVMASDIDISGTVSSNGTAPRTTVKSAALQPATLQTRLLDEEIDYDVSNFHFSAQPASSYGAANCGAGPTEFDLLEGDMLYLPTGWFHQVTSRQGRHMAVNYWWRALNWRGAVEFERERSEALYDKLLA